MKKLISIALALATIFSVTACSQNSTSGNSSIKDIISQDNTSHADPVQYFTILTQSRLKEIQKHSEEVLTSEVSFSGRYLVDEDPENRIIDVLEDYHKGKHEITWESDLITDTYCPFYKAIKERFPFYNQQIESIIINGDHVCYYFETDWAAVRISFNGYVCPITENFDFSQPQEDFYAPLVTDNNGGHKEIVNHINGAGAKYIYYGSEKGQLGYITILIDNWRFDFEFSEIDYEKLKEFTEKETIENFIADVREIAENEFYDYR